MGVINIIVAVALNAKLVCVWSYLLADEATPHRDKTYLYDKHVY